jgi:sulfate adenylyltransferase
MAKDSGIDGGLVPVHGGLKQPVDCRIPLSERKAFLSEAEKLPSVGVSNADLSTVYRIADGTLSPLEGPMVEEAWHRALDESVIAREGKNYAWTIPLSLPLTDSEAKSLSSGGSATIRNEAGESVAIVDSASIFEWDKPKYVRSVYGTERLDHPGGRAVEADSRSMLLGGQMRTLPQPIHPEYGQFMFAPSVTRALIRDRKWTRALAFQTRNPLHRAHEYALVAGIETLTAKGEFAGAVLNPLVGELKGDDVPAAMRMRCYQTLLEGRLLGEGDKDEALWKNVGYDIADVFTLIGLDIKMFYGGPSEAIMHAIYRQNSGFSDIVIGRKHADAPYEDGKAIWGDFDAQEIFDHLPGQLEIQPCKIGFAAFYESLGRVDLTERHPDEKPVTVSGTKVREQLKGGERPDERIMRPEVADILIEAFGA